MLKIISFVCNLENFIIYSFLKVVKRKGYYYIVFLNKIEKIYNSFIMKIDFIGLKEENLCIDLNIKALIMSKAKK